MQVQSVYKYRENSKGFLGPESQDVKQMHEERQKSDAMRIVPGDCAVELEEVLKSGDFKKWSVVDKKRLRIARTLLERGIDFPQAIGRLKKLKDKAHWNQQLIEKTIQRMEEL